jgi:hypothetical protein
MSTFYLNHEVLDLAGFFLKQPLASDPHASEPVPAPKYRRRYSLFFAFRFN